MILLTILILWLIPILLFGMWVWFNMESGESVEEFVDRKDLEIDFVVIWFPVINVVLLIRLLFKQLLNYILDLRKP